MGGKYIPPWWVILTRPTCLLCHFDSSYREFLVAVHPDFWNVRTSLHIGKWSHVEQHRDTEYQVIRKYIPDSEMN